MLDKHCNEVSPLIPNNLLLHNLKATVLEGKTRPESWRRSQLARMSCLIEDNEKQVMNCLYEDLGKPPTEAFFELVALRQELKVIDKNLSQWMKVRRVNLPISLQPGEAKVKPEPLGCVLIIGPWNYPFSLMLQPFISALAAGNTAVLKPSEHAPNTSALIANLINKYFPTNIAQVVQGDAFISASLVEEEFDHIFFTGGSATGKKIMRAASKNLTPVTLELGGKSPAIILENANINVTARRLTWGKCLNSGQTCIAPNHLLVQSQVKQSLISSLENSIKEFYGCHPLESPDLGKIINQEQFSKLNKLLSEAKKEKQVLLGGDIDEQKRRISPTIIEVKNHNDPLMEEELFGPLMPLMTIESLDEAISIIRQQPKPLALYMFGGSETNKATLLNQTSSGGVCFNDVVLQAGVPSLPFGGVGASGMGQYHGKYGFDTFSHQKSILQRPFWLDFKLRYPPYKLNLSSLKRLLG